MNRKLRNVVAAAFLIGTMAVVGVMALAGKAGGHGVLGKMLLRKSRTLIVSEPSMAHHWNRVDRSGTIFGPKPCRNEAEWHRMPIPFSFTSLATHVICFPPL
jgi:hypothetical protein